MFAFTVPPALTVNTMKNIENSSIIVQWDAVDDSLHTTYTVTWTDDRDLHGGDTVDEQTSYTITGLTLDTVYTITVTPSNKCGGGPPFKTNNSFSSGSEFSVKPTTDITTITTINVAATTTTRAITITTVFTTTTNNIVTTPNSPPTTSATNLTSESNSKFEKYVNTYIIQNCYIELYVQYVRMYVHKLYTSTYAYGCILGM